VPEMDVAGKDFAPAIVQSLVHIAQAAARPVVLIDGGSGAGKSTLGTALAEALGAQLLPLDLMYPGWDGLEAASDELFDEVLSSAHPRWRGWDWELGVATSWSVLDATLPLVVEGSGALSRRNRGSATLGIWVELDELARQARALARDGDRYAPHWDRWAAQERAFAVREQPSQLADVILDVRTGRLEVRAT
jgi:predicted kinase